MRTAAGTQAHGNIGATPPQWAVTRPESHTPRRSPGCWAGPFPRPRGYMPVIAHLTAVSWGTGESVGEESPAHTPMQDAHAPRKYALARRTAGLRTSPGLSARRPRAQQPTPAHYVQAPRRHHHEAEAKDQSRAQAASSHARSRGLGNTGSGSWPAAWLRRDTHGPRTAGRKSRVRLRARAPSQAWRESNDQT